MPNRITARRRTDKADPRTALDFLEAHADGEPVATLIIDVELVQHGIDLLRAAGLSWPMPRILAAPLSTEQLADVVALVCGLSADGLRSEQVRTTTAAA